MRKKQTKWTNEKSGIKGKIKWTKIEKLEKLENWRQLKKRTKIERGRKIEKKILKI